MAFIRGEDADGAREMLQQMVPLSRLSTVPTQTPASSVHVRCISQHVSHVSPWFRQGKDEAVQSSHRVLPKIGQDMLDYLG